MTLKSSIYRKSCGFTNYSLGLAHALGLFIYKMPDGVFHVFLMHYLILTDLAPFVF